MLKIIFKIALLLILVFLFNLGIKAIVPKYWFDTTAYTKHAFYDEHKDEYGIVFLGSSRTRSGLNPLHFDKRMAQINKGNNLKSFNFAVAASTCGEIFQAANDILDNPSKSLKYLFIELRSSSQSISVETNKNDVHTDRRRYWLTLPNYITACRQLYSLKSSYLTEQERRESLKNYTISFYENSVNLGMYQSFIHSYLNPRIEEDQLGAHKNGFKALDYVTNPQNVKSRKNFLKTNGKEAENRRENSIKAYNTTKIEDFPDNQFYLKRVKKLIARGEEKNIKVIFVVPPLLTKKSYFEETRKLVSQINPTNKIVLANAKQYPLLYDINNLWDEGHLNKSGSDVYSIEMANNFSEILANEK